MNNPPEEKQTNAYRLPSHPPTLPPLTKYTREPKVEKQAKEILMGTRTQVLHRLKIVEREHPDSLLEETLISLCRLYYRCDYKSEFIEAAMQTLFARAAKIAVKQAQKWHQMTSTEREDFANDVRSCLIKRIVDLNPEEEFWEVKYAFCFKRFYLDVSHPYEKFTKNEEEAISAFEGDEDSEVDRVECAEDFTLPRMEEALYLQFALKSLTPKERTFVALTYEQCSQEQIASHLGYKSTRSIRYIKDAVKEKLEQWYNCH